jgi:tRNA dimethylallyltransferase
MIMGPTASGKTGLSIALANHFNTSVLSVDSRQFYREMSIGTAKPDENELAAAPHYFINNISIHDTYTAGRFEKDALLLLQELFSHTNIVIACGGSTLYIKALLEGLDEIPAVSNEIKQQVQQLYDDKGIDGLQQQLQELDPEYFLSADVNNPRRLMRALEVTFSAGIPYTAFLQRTPKERDFNIIKIGLEVPREELYKKIEIRCEQMLAKGLMEEVKSLYPFRALVPLQTVGYQEFFDFFDGKYTFEQAVDIFKQHTRNYAKRQMTWFRREKDVAWFSPTVVEEIVKYVENNVGRR